MKRRASRHSPGPGRSRLEWALPAGLWFLFLTTGVGSTPFEHTLSALLVVALAYALLALFLYLGARFARDAGRVWGALACVALALVPAAQLRMDAELLQRRPVLGLFVALVGTAAWFALRAGAPREPRVALRPLLASCGAFVALFLVVGVSARTSHELRWHWLKHHRLFGMPLYALDARSLVAEREALWNSRGSLAHPAEHADRAGPAPVVFEKPPHVIFLMLDTLRADALAALGGGPDVMPAMNARVERSVLFTDVHTNASWTRASCASIFTGLQPEEHGAARFHERLAEEWHTLPEQLSAAGYQTAAFVANWVQVGKATGFGQGFEDEAFHEMNPGDEILRNVGSGAQETDVRGGYARAEQINATVLDWLESDARDPYKPLFLYLHYLDPHSPYLEPPEPGTQDDRRERKRGLYRQELRYLDRHLDGFLHDLDEVLSGPKVIVFTSDHGEEFYEHDDWGHGHSLYREVLWVPLFVTLPSGRSGRVDTPLESRDLYRMVQDLALDPALDLEAWAAERARPTRYASQYLDRADDARPDKKWTGLRRVDGEGWSLIWSAYGPTWELYDASSDPGELRNLADDADLRLETLMGAMRKAVRFWTAPLRVERSAEDLRFLRDLGYAGGVDDEPRP